MNFQQVKPACCDVFIWLGVWRDKIRYWVLASREVAHSNYDSTGQHGRGTAPCQAGQYQGVREVRGEVQCLIAGSSRGVRTPTQLTWDERTPGG